MSTVLRRNSGISPPWNSDLWQYAIPLAVALGVLYIIAIAGLWIVYRIQDTVVLNVGDSYARPHLVNFAEDEHNDKYNFAYTGRDSAIALPGPGSGPYRVRLALSGWRPQAFEAPVLTVHSEAFTTTFPVTDPHILCYEVVLPATTGDLLIRLDSNLYTPSAQDPRQLGVVVDRVEVQSLGWLPPLTTTALVLSLITLLCWFGLRVGLSSSQAALLTGVVLLGLLVGLAQFRLLITVTLSRWVVTLLLLHLMLGPLQQLISRVMRRHDLTITPTGWNWLWAIFGLALLFKLGGALYPHAIFFDQAAHTKRVQMVLDGRFIELYQPGFTSYMGGTVGLGSGYMPYSPLWYLIIAPLRLVGFSIGDAMNGLNAILDVSKGLMIFLIALKTIGRQRAALLASGLYHLLLMPYFLMSWGNYPTQFGLWAALLAITFLTLNYDHMPTLKQRGPFIIWTALLVLALLSYTMIGLLAFSMLALVCLFKALRRARSNWSLIQALVAGMLAAEIFAFAIYHFQFVPAIVSSTIPSVVSNITDNSKADLRSDVEARESPLSNVLANSGFLRNHTTDLLLLIILVGIVWLHFDSRAGHYRALWSAWFAILVLYTLVSAYVADMVLKHIFFLMPLFCICIALVLDKIWGRWRYGRLIVIPGLMVLGALAAEHWWVYVLFDRHY